MRALTNITLTFIPMNLPDTIAEDQAAKGVISCAPKVGYPYHHHGSDVNKFKSLVAVAGKDIELRLAEWY